MTKVRDLSKLQSQSSGATSTPMPVVVAVIVNVIAPPLQVVGEAHSAPMAPSSGVAKNPA